MAGDTKTLVGVLDTRVRDGVLEGLCHYDDGSREWKPPTSATVEVVNDRTGEAAHVSNVNIGGGGDARRGPHST